MAECAALFRPTGETETLLLRLDLFEFDEIQCERGRLYRAPRKTAVEVESLGGRGNGVDHDEASGHALHCGHMITLPTHRRVQHWDQPRQHNLHTDPQQ